MENPNININIITMLCKLSRLKKANCSFYHANHFHMFYLLSYPIFKSAPKFQFVQLTMHTNASL